MPVSSRLFRPLAAVALGAALLAPLQPVLVASATPSTTHASPAAKPKVRATQTSLTAYGDTDAAGRVHLSGSVRWGDGKLLRTKQAVELWGRTGGRWVLVEKAVTDKSGDVELAVAPRTHTTYQLRYAGSRSAALAAVARASTSSQVEVRALARVSLKAPAKVGRGTTFVVTGTVSPTGAGRVVTLTGDGRTFTTLRTRADGTFSGHVRLRQTTKLAVSVARTGGLDGAAAAPRVVRVS